MTLKERVKFILACLFFIMVLTGALIFFTRTSWATIKDVFAGADAVYYSWRDVFALLYLPVMGYFDVLVFLFLFLPFTVGITKLWCKVIKAVWGYIILAFILAFPLSLYISFVPLADYYSCGQKGPFSGTDYVKDPKMCEQFEYHPEKDKSDEQ
ncbi:MAG: DUF1240 domain-containing protein [Kluyvera sp.]